MALSAWGQLAQYRYKGEETTPVAAPIQEQSGIPYVSLNRLAAQLGGRCRLSSLRVELELKRQTAWVGLGGMFVETSTNQFSLTQPVIQQGSEALIAVEDVQAFFEGAFSMELEPSGSSEEPVEGETAEESVALEEPVTQSTVEVIILDPGHGGSDPGATGINGLVEKEMTLSVAQGVQRELQGLVKGKTLMTRRDDTDMPDRARTNYAMSNKGKLFVSVHGGAAYSPVTEGFCVYYSDTVPEPKPGEEQSRGPGVSQAHPSVAASRRLAEDVAAALDEALEATNHGVRRAPIRVLMNVPAPGILIEVGCLTNREEADRLAAQDYRDKIAEGIARGIQRYASPVQ